jgi:hypothetical protein
LIRTGVFSRTQPKYFERVTQDGVRPAIIFTDDAGEAGWLAKLWDLANSNSAD